MSSCRTWWSTIATVVVSIHWLTQDGRGQELERPRSRSPHGSASVKLGTPEEIGAEIGWLRMQVEELRQSDATKERRIAELERQLRAVEPLEDPVTMDGVVAVRTAKVQEPKSPLDQAVESLQTDESALDRAVRELETQDQATATPRVAGLQLQLIDISLDALFAAGGSTQRDEPLQNLQGGGHDPRKRGFTVQNVELSIVGAVDPYLNGEAHIIYFLDPIEGETVVELEEAFFTTRSLPCGLQIEGGTFFTEFGRLNPTHPHAWHWLDQPVINSRLFGPDGMRGPGVRLGWLVPFDWYSQVHLGMQNANGETMASFLANDEFFEERPIGGRPFDDRDVRSLRELVYLVRWENSWTTCCDEVTWLAGASALFGPNTTGPDGETEIYGLDLTMKWKPAKNERGWPFLVWETEWMTRDYAADNFTDLGDPADLLDDVVLRGERLRDTGFYTQLLYGCKPRWAVGVRYEFLHGNGPSLDETLTAVSRNEDPFRDRRHRLAPLVAWYPTEYSRFRLQYNFDHAQHLDEREVHSIWFGAEFVLGAHPAHRF